MFIYSPFKSKYMPTNFRCVCAFSCSYLECNYSWYSFQVKDFTILSLRFLFVYSVWNCLDFLLPWTDIFYKFSEFIAINFSDIYFLGSSGTPQLNTWDCFCLSFMSITIFFICSIFLCVSASFWLVSVYLL